MSYTGRFQVWRGDASGGELAPFDVEVNEGEVVLDIIHRIQATQAQDLAVRWNCKAGKCGSCSAEVNGRPRLLCMTRMSTFEIGEMVTVTPLRAFPVMRDLVTDVSYNYVKARQIPSFSPPPGVGPGEFRMQQLDVERSQEFRKCIECFLCQDVCHVIRDHEDNKPAFSGPRFFARIAELDMHPLDQLDRKKQAQESFGLGMCNITKCCSEVCPEHIKITDNAIIPMKERVVDRKYDPATWLGGRISRRPGMAPLTASNGAAVSESAARASLRAAPADPTALGALRGALVAKGRLGEAVIPSRRLLPAETAPRRARLAAHSDHAWLVLRAVEAGELEPRVGLGEAERSIAAAQQIEGSGRTLVGLHALAAVLAGRLEEARRLVAEARLWHRGPAERSDDELTAAHVLRLSGDVEGARVALQRGRSLWPDNPRLPPVGASLATGGDER